MLFGAKIRKKNGMTKMIVKRMCEGKKNKRQRVVDKTSTLFNDW